MRDCLFCRIVAGEIPAGIVHQDDHCVAFEDINPQAPTHVLLVARTHIASLNEVGDAEAPLVGHLLAIASRIARERGHGESGYRAVFNCQEGAGQSVFHLHLHLLGGRSFRWPPG